MAVCQATTRSQSLCERPNSRSPLRTLFPWILLLFSPGRLYLSGRQSPFTVGSMNAVHGHCIHTQRQPTLAASEWNGPHHGAVRKAPILSQWACASAAGVGPHTATLLTFFERMYPMSSGFESTAFGSIPGCNFWAPIVAVDSAKYLLRDAFSHVPFYVNCCETDVPQRK